MNKKLSILFLWLLTALCALGATADEALAKFIKDSGVPSGSLGVKIMDLSNGKVVAEHNPDKPLIPASIMKSITTAALLEEAGPNWNYVTKIYTDGPNHMGILRGNIIVEGSGDPSINSGKEPFTPDIVDEIVKALEENMITEIEGDIIIDDSYLQGPTRPQSWAKADFSNYYGTASHSFNYARNAQGKSAVENPAKVFKDALKSRIRQKGITFGGNTLPEGKRQLLTQHVSPTLDEIMKSCMNRSDNLYAELFLRTYGKLKGGDGSTAHAAQEETKHWQDKKMPLDGVTIVDGSGLSRTNRVTADFMTGVLDYMSENPNYAAFFPLAGLEGTMSKFLAKTPLEGYIAMKTGSMTGIQCYAGYKLDDDYVPTHVVVLIMNDIPANRDKVKAAAQTMLLEIFQ